MQAAHCPEEEVWEVWRLYQQSGDLGSAGSQLLAGAQAPKATDASDLTVEEVYDRLRAIAAVSGRGAMQRKVHAFADLLRALPGSAIAYVVRMAQGKLRLQIGDAALIDGLSFATVDTTALRPAVAHAYNVCSDLGPVAATLRTGGAAALAEIHPAPGRPVRAELAERLSSAQAIIDTMGTALVEPKYDGVHLQVHKDVGQIWLFTRRPEDVTAAFPKLVAAARQQIRAERAILDGETIGFDPQTQRLLPFQETVPRRRAHGVAQMAASFPVRYYAFDLLLLDDADWMSRPQRERSTKLRAVIQEADAGTIQVTPQLETQDAADLQRYFEEQVRQGLKGIAAKQPDAPYCARPSRRCAPVPARCRA